MKQMEQRVYYHKLVRDLIKDKIIGKGETCSVRTVTDEEEFRQELLKKVVEESKELGHATDRDTFLEEYCDVMVVLDALTAVFELSEADIKLALEENIARKGSYTNRHFLEWSAHGTNKHTEAKQ